MTHSRIKIAGLALLAGTSLAGNTTWAQAAQSDGGAEAPAEASQLEEIIVTAQRRSESLQEVPIAITAISSDTIERTGIQTSQDIAVASPGLTTTTNRSGLTPYLRGVGTQSANNDGSIAVYVDNVYYGSPQGAIFGLGGIERIEVLKGPQGTLFGRNATGGLVHFITRDPSETPEVRASVGYGNYETLTGSLYATAGLAQGVALNVAAYASNQGKGWGTNVNFPGEKVFYRNEWSVRSKLKVELGERTTVLLAGDYSEFESDIASQRQVIPGAIVRGSLVRHVGGFYDINSSIHESSKRDFGNGAEGRAYGFSGRIDHELADGITVTSITAYRNTKSPTYLDNDLTPARTQDALFTDIARTFQQEVLVNGTSDRLKWTLGGIYYHALNGQDPFILLNAFSYVAHMTQDSWAGYGQLSYEVTDDTTLTVGGRYTVDKLRVFAEYYTPAGVIDPTNGTAGQPESRLRRKWSEPTWRVSLDHQFSRDLLVYASYNRGYKAGAYNPSTTPSIVNSGPINPANPDILVGDAVNPEKLDAYEIGLKSDLFDRQLRLNLAAFYYDYRNIQLKQLAPNQTATNLFNASSAEIKGVDFETIFAPRIPTGRLELRVGGSYIDGTYGDFPSAPSTVPNAPTAGGNSFVFINAKGKRVVRTPRFTSTVAVDYTIPVSDDYDLGVNLTWQHKDKFYWEVDNRLVQPATEIVNAQISLGRADDMWRLRLWGRNLTDTRYFAVVDSSRGGDGGSPAAPRTYGLTLDVKFGG